jgi:hypothetical protein
MQSFLFSFYNLRNGELFYDGAASVYSDDRLMAEFGDISFYLSEDFESIDIFAPDDSELAHLSGRYVQTDSGEVTPYGYRYNLRIDVRLDGLVWDSGNKYMLDGEVKVYSDILGGGDDIESQIADYLKLHDSEVSEWFSIDCDETLSAKVGYPVWIAEYYVGQEEDTNLCVDAVVQAGEFNGSNYTLILHTIRDADLDMNTDIDFGARIMELFAAIEVVTV